jgi:septum formation topological specificity factor MinE
MRKARIWLIVAVRRETKSGPDAMTSLQIELVLALLLDHAQVRSQRCLGDRLGIGSSAP